MAQPRPHSQVGASVVTVTANEIHQCQYLNDFNIFFKHLHGLLYKITDGYSLSNTGSSSSALVDLMELNASASTTKSDPEPSSLQSLTQNVGINLLDDELMSLGKHNSLLTECGFSTQMWNILEKLKQFRSAV